MPRKKKLKVAIYCRVSTKAEAQKTSIDNQPKYFERLFKNPKIDDNYEIYKYYAECNTGTKLNRPAFSDMLKDAGVILKESRGKDIAHPDFPDHIIKQITYVPQADNSIEPAFDEIWVKSTSRFARNISAQALIDALLIQHVYVVFKNNNLSTRNESDIPTIIKMLTDDMLYSMMNSVNMRLARQQAIDEGMLMTSGKLYGYDYHRRTPYNAPYYEINKKEAAVVRQVFNWCIEGYGDRKIANMLTEQGVYKKYKRPKSDDKNTKKDDKTKSKHTDNEFSVSTVRSILKNEKYMGLLNAGKWTTGKLFSKLNSPIVTADYKKNLQDVDSIPAIVTPEIWYKAEEKRKERCTNDNKGRPRGLNSARYPFNNLLVCSYCRNNFRHDRDHGKEFYTCTLKDTKGTAHCNVNNVYQYKIDELIDCLRNGDLNEIINTDIRDYLITLIYHIENAFNILNNQETNLNLNDAYKELELRKKAIEDLAEAMLKQEDNSTIRTIVKNKFDEASNLLKEAEEKVNHLKTTPSESISRIKTMLQVCNNLLYMAENQKEVYTTEEVIGKLDKIIVYGETKNRKGGKPPQPLLIPFLKDTEKARALININLPQIKYKIGGSIPDDETYDIIDSKPIPLKDDFIHLTKGKLEKFSSEKLIGGGNAFFTSKGDLGYIKNLGVAGVDINTQIKEKLKTLENQLYELQNQFSE